MPMRFALFLSIVAACCLFGDEGRIPLYQPTTITQPGHYVVTRNITVTSGTIFTIQASNVVLDLNRFTLESPGSDIISIQDGRTDIAIRNGRIVGGNSGIAYSGTTVRIRIIIEDLDILNPAMAGILLQGVEYVEVSNTIVRKEAPGNMTVGIYAFCSSCTFSGRIAGNEVDGTMGSGITLMGLLRGEVVNNRVSRFSSSAWGIYSNSSDAAVPTGANRFEGNLIQNGGVGGGLWAVEPSDLIRNNVLANLASGIVSSDGSLVADNVLTSVSGTGILIGASSTVRNNRVTGTDAHTGTGISLGGEHSLAEGNSVQRFNWGITANYGSDYCRNNYHSDNTVVALGCTDGGGNIP